MTFREKVRQFAATSIGAAVITAGAANAADMETMACAGCNFTQDRAIAGIKATSSKVPVTIQEQRQAVSVGTQRNAVKIDHTRQPVTVNHTRKAVTVDHTRQPVTIDHTRKAVTVDHTRQPVTIDHTRKAVTVNHTRKAVTVNHTRQPVTVNHTRIPVSVSHPRIPVKIHHVEKDLLSKDDPRMADFNTPENDSNAARIARVREAAQRKMERHEKGVAGNRQASRTVDPHER